MVKSKFAKGMFSLFCLASILLVASCTQPTSGGSSGGNNNSSETIAAGWYAYTTNANSAMPQTTYLYIKVDGSVERAGSSSYEYKDSQLKMIQQQLSYSTCKKNADGTNITFASCDAPSWATDSGKNSGNDNPEEKICPYAPGEYLDCAKDTAIDESHLYDNLYGSNYYLKEVTWPINKNIQLWSAKELQYTDSCSDSFGYINFNNVFVIGKDMTVGETIRICMMDSAYINYVVKITFTKAVPTGGGNIYRNKI